MKPRNNMDKVKIKRSPWEKKTKQNLNIRNLGLKF